MIINPLKWKIWSDKIIRIVLWSILVLMVLILLGGILVRIPYNNDLIETWAIYLAYYLVYGGFIGVYAALFAGIIRIVWLKLKK